MCCQFFYKRQAEKEWLASTLGPHGYEPTSARYIAMTRCAEGQTYVQGVGYV